MRIWTKMTRLSSTTKFLAPRLRARTVPDAAIRYTVAKLPPHYQKFYDEWNQESTPIHWIPCKVNWAKNPRDGTVNVVRDRPIPVTYPHQMHQGIWGGEGVVDGLVKKGKWRSPVPKFWVPSLSRSVVYSEVLDKYLSVIVTRRALRLIDEFNGFDAYLLKNPASELKSLLALKLKKKILLALVNRDFAQNDPKKQSELLDKYKEYLIPVNEIEWYGLSVDEAKAKYELQLSEAKVNVIQPLKLLYRQELIEKLREEAARPPSQDIQESVPKGSWLTKLNPFSKPDRKLEQ